MWSPNRKLQSHAHPSLAAVDISPAAAERHDILGDPTTPARLSSVDACATGCAAVTPTSCTSGKALFAEIRFLYFSLEQLMHVVEDGHVDEDLVHGAILQQVVLQSRITRRPAPSIMRGLPSISTRSAALSAVAGVSRVEVPEFRSHVQVVGAFEPGKSPALDGQPTTTTSSPFFYAGSLWVLDVKRYLHTDGDDEFVAVYLRRRLPQEENNYVPYIDERPRVVVSFSIRLSAARGAPLANSICGRAMVGKSFGWSAEHSWGWEAFSRFNTISSGGWAE